VSTESTISTPAPAPRSKRLALRVGVLLALVLAAATGIGSLRVATGPLEVSPGAPARPFESAVLRVATYNIHSGIGADEKANLAWTAEALKGFDIAGLQEVHGSFSAGGDQADQLARMLNVRAVFAPTELRWYHEHFGNGLLYRPDIDGYRRIPMPGSAGRGKRNVLQTRILTRAGPVRILVTHIDRGADRTAQLDLVRRLFLEAPAPAILMGDMNTDTADPLIAPFRNAAGVTDGLKQILGDGDVNRIDYIFTRGLKWRDGGLKDNGASDHPLAWGELELPER
jgi:endonuclease/exonuclease/phosphatase family metal-dependent hydrolase